MSLVNWLVDHNSVYVTESMDKQHEAMKNAVRAAKKCERLEKEMKDMDKVACTINSEKTILAKKVAQSEVS
jgi:hypothetical protein